MILVSKIQSLSISDAWHSIFWDGTRIIDPNEIYNQQHDTNRKIYSLKNLRFQDISEIIEFINK